MKIKQKNLLKKEGNITVYSVNNGKISDVKYIKNAEELAGLFK